jgi:hypothetical protein
MAEDAITDELTDVNASKGARVRSNDPRARKHRREPRVFTFDQMHAFAAAAGGWEPLVRVISDCGLRLGEVLGLDRADFAGETICVRSSAHNGVFGPGDQPTKRHVRVGPCPPSTPPCSGRCRREWTRRCCFPPRPEAVVGAQLLPRTWSPTCRAQATPPTWSCRTSTASLRWSSAGSSARTRVRSATTSSTTTSTSSRSASTAPRAPSRAALLSAAGGRVAADPHPYKSPHKQIRRLNRPRAKSGREADSPLA